MDTMKTYSSSMIKILIAEHDAGNLELIHQELKTSGIIFRRLSQTSKNIQPLKEFLPDIILCDFTFPSFLTQQQL